MAITKLIGNVNGYDVIFKQGDGGNWAAIVPANMNGEYVVELEVWDDAGNCNYTVQMLFLVDPTTLQVVIKPLNYNAKITNELFKIFKRYSVFTYKEAPEKYQAYVVPQNFYYKAAVV